MPTPTGAIRRHKTPAISLRAADRGGTPPARLRARHRGPAGIRHVAGAVLQLGRGRRGAAARRCRVAGGLRRRIGAFAGPAAGVPVDRGPHHGHARTALRQYGLRRSAATGRPRCGRRAAAAEWLRQGIEQGIDHQRALLRRQAERRFGPATARQLAGRLAAITDVEQFALVGDWIIDCSSGGALLALVGNAGAAPSQHLLPLRGV